MSADEKAAEEYDDTDREGDLAISSFMHLNEAAIIARLDVRSVCVFALAEALAHLEFFTGTGTTEAVERVQDLVAARVACLAEQYETVPEPEAPSTPPSSGSYH